MSQSEADNSTDAEPRSPFWPLAIIAFGLALTLGWTFTLLWSTGSLVWAVL